MPADGVAERVRGAGRGGLVRLIGRMPFQGRHGTLQLIRSCHDVEGPEGLPLALARLRHAVAMNCVRHVVPLPAGVLAALGWATLAGRGPVPLRPVAWTAAAVTVALAAVSALAAYAQASIHWTLARELRDGRRRRRRVPSPDRPRTGWVAATASQRRDRVVTRALVVTALCLVPAGLAVEIAVLCGRWTA